MKRSARDYLVYLLTMSLISALMYTFNSLLFQNEAGKYYDAEDMLEVLVVLATVFKMFTHLFILYINYIPIFAYCQVFIHSFLHKI